MTNTPEFDFDDITANQKQAEVPYNTAMLKIEEALGDPLTVLVDNTNAVTLTSVQLRRSLFFQLDDDSPVPDDAITITVPDHKRGQFVVFNNTSFPATIEVSGQSVPSPVVLAGSIDTLVLSDASVRHLTAGAAAAPVERFVFIPVEGHITPTATGGCAALATIASAADQPDITSLDFDLTTEEHAQLKHIFEKVEHAGNVSMQFLSSQTGGSTPFGVAWNAKAVGLSDDQTFLSNFETARVALDTLTTADDLYLSERTGFIKTLLPAALDMSVFDIFRDPANSFDDLAVDARLNGVILHYWENQVLDPLWASVELLFGADGVDTDTTVDDESDNAHVATYVADAQCDTAKSHFSKGSLRVDGTADVVTFGDEADFDLGSGNFCMEGYFTWNSDPATFQMLMGKHESTGNQRSYVIAYDGASSNILTLQLSTTGADGIVPVSFAFVPTLNVKYHIAADYDGTTYRLFLDGLLVDSDVSSNTLFNSNAEFSIGAKPSGNDPFDGWADECRMTKASRYPAAFTVPQAPFPRG